MAKKNEANSQEEKVQEESKKMTIPKDVTLTPQEQAAFDELQAAPKGTGKSYRLKEPNTQYTDPDSRETWAADQSKPLPENVSAETLERIKKGFLVEDSGA